MSKEALGKSQKEAPEQGEPQKNSGAQKKMKKVSIFFTATT
jgi:hypothetical protein